MNTPITFPGQLIANLPGSLGFYPHDSVILVGVHQESESNGSVEMGAIARMDVSDFHMHIDEAFDMLWSTSSFVVAFIVSHRERMYVDWIAQQLSEFGAADNAGILACWSLEEVLVGEPFTRHFGPEHECADCSALWGDGRVLPIMSTASMRPWLATGRLPEPSREDLLTPFSAGHGPLELADAARWAEVATHSANEVVRAATAGRHSAAAEDALVVAPEDFLQDVRRLLAELKSGDSSVEEPETLATAAMWLSHTMLRDIVLNNVVSHECAVPLLTAVAQTFDGTIRSNALCLLAARHAKEGFPMLAGPLLELAAEEDPEHSLTSLMLRLHRAGMMTQLTDNLHRGGKAALRAWRKHLKERNRGLARHLQRAS